MALTGVDSFKSFLENAGHPADVRNTAVLAGYREHLARVAGVTVGEYSQLTPDAAEKAVNAGRAALTQAGLDAPLPEETKVMYPSPDIAALTQDLAANRLAIADELGVSPDELHSMRSDGTVIDLRSQVVDTRRDLASV